MTKIEPITRSTDGATFVKSDLHVHTPGSYDVSEDISPGEFVDAVLAENIELVAITDHDCSGWYQEVRNAAVDTDLEVLPGVEITTSQGAERRVHMTAIFSPENANKVNYVLSNIGIDPADAGSTQASKSIWEICDLIRDNDGLPILAHIDKEAGADFEFERNNPIKERIFDDQRVAALEVTKRETCDRDAFSEFSMIMSSDAHCSEHIGTRTTHMKMAEPSFEGLRTALHDPESRISLDENHSNHAAITGIRCEGKFFANKELQLNTGLNCLIGGKGTGKSTVIEHIRYALDVPPRVDRIQEEYEALVKATLGEDGIVEIHLTTGEGQSYSVRREFDCEPIIHRLDGTQVPMSIEQFKDEYFDIEVYSQRELLELTRDYGSQMELLDSYFELHEPLEEVGRIEDVLVENGEKLTLARDRAEEYEDELKNVEVLRENIRTLEDKGVTRYVEGGEEWEKEGMTLDRMTDRVSSMRNAIDDLSVSNELDIARETEDSPNNELLISAFEALETLETRLQRDQQEMLETLRETEDQIESFHSQWENRNEQRKEKLQEIAAEIEDEIGVDIHEYFDLKAKESALQETEQELEEVRDEIDVLKSKRATLLDELDSARSDLTSLRQAGIQRINKEMDEVRIELQENENKKQYTAWLNEILRGSNVRNDDREALAENFAPQELASTVESRQTATLIREGLTETAAENVVNHTPLREQLYELELQKIDDKPIIQIKDDSGWKPLHEMSDGQRCTALLSIAMLERSVPLVIDQPEDMLDNKFIYTTVVRLLRAIRRERQVITATHNANIPVLGDAEQIVVLSSSGGQGHFTTRGSIDESSVKTKVQRILEGGRDAFHRRSQKYGQL